MKKLLLIVLLSSALAVQDWLSRLLPTCTDSTVCYHYPLDVGCFEQGPFTPYCPMLVLPEDPVLHMPEFTLYTPEEPSRGQQIEAFVLNESVAALQWNASRYIQACKLNYLKRFQQQCNLHLGHLFVIIHGFSFDTSLDWLLETSRLLTEKGHNAIVTNWTVAAMGPNYLQAAANGRVVGRIVALLLHRIHVIWQRSLMFRVTVVGFSLGAHVAGYVGAALPGGVGRIIALDPAGPVFEQLLPQARLDANDGYNVQVIHTNGLPIIQGGAGTMLPMGDVDFYPNGGKRQPGCKMISLDELNTDFWAMNYTRLFESAACHHYRAVYLFQDAIRHSADYRSIVDERYCELEGIKCTDVNAWETGICQASLFNECRFSVTQPVYCPSGSYFFATVDSENESYCGERWIVEMHLSAHVYGLITVIWSNGRQNATTEIDSGNIRIFPAQIQRHIALPRSMTFVTNATLIYTPNLIPLPTWALFGGAYSAGIVRLSHADSGVAFVTREEVELPLNSTVTVAMYSTSERPIQTTVTYRIPDLEPELKNFTGLSATETPINTVIIS